MKIKSSFTTVLEPYLILILYKNNDELSYIEKANIVDNKAKAFTPLTKQDISKLSKELGNISLSLLGGLMPKTVAYYKPINVFTFAWRYEKKEANLKYGDTLNIKNGIKKLPFILFMILDETLYAWAYKTWKDYDTDLYYLPLHNIHEDNSVCMGSVNLKPVKSDNFETYIKRLEYLFFELKGTAIHNSKAFETNINTLHKNIHTSFPVNQLIKVKNTKFKNIINGHI